MSASKASTRKSAAKKKIAKAAPARTKASSPAKASSATKASSAAKASSRTKASTAPVQAKAPAKATPPGKTKTVGTKGAEAKAAGTKAAGTKAAGTKAAGKQGAPAKARPVGERPIILLVDDFPDAREMYLEYLEFSGFQPAEASNGAEAIEQALALSPAVILMDLAMPVMDGWEATRRLKADARTRSIPVIAVTGHALEGDAERARQAGCDGVLSKPCLPESLVHEVRRLLAASTRRT